MCNITIGIDVSKDTLDLYRLPDRATLRVSNDDAGYQAVLDWIGAHRVERIVYEATGPYTRDFERVFARAGLPLVKVNPRRARRFAEAIGVLAKTDPVDAAVLAHMGAILALDPRAPASETLQTLRELHRARRALLKDRTAAKNRAKILRVMLLKGHNDQRLTQIDEQIGAIDRAIDILIAEDKDRARRLDILTSIPGIATATAVALIIEMPELGTLEGKQAASLAGLAPITRQSGTWTGRAHIRGGRARLRQALYMPALVACRFNPDLKAKYDQLTTAGKPPKIAITAVMRKLLLLANALLRDDRKWNQSLA